MAQIVVLAADASHIHTAVLRGFLLMQIGCEIRSPRKGKWGGNCSRLFLCMCAGCDAYLSSLMYYCCCTLVACFLQPARLPPPIVFDYFGSEG